MIWYFIFPAPHPKYVHPPGTAINFSHLRVKGHFQQIFFNTPYVPDGCIYLSNILWREIQVLEVSFDVIFDHRNFWKFCPESLREIEGQLTSRALGRNFHGDIESVLEGLWKCLYPHFIRLGPLNTFLERMRTEKYLGPSGGAIPSDPKCWFLAIFGTTNLRGCAWWVQILFGAGRTPSGSQWVQSS